jgi:hypothetical protein
MVDSETQHIIGAKLIREFLVEVGADTNADVIDAMSVLLGLSIQGARQVAGHEAMVHMLEMAHAFFTSTEFQQEADASAEATKAKH